jgi:signal transduction histidine kinase
MNKSAGAPPLALIVDDDLTMRLLAREALESMGLRIEEAADGVEAFECFRTHRPDIVLMDVVMPRQDGFKTCAQIRSLLEGAHTPVLIMTGLEDVDSIARAYEVGCTDFIIKPWQGLILRQRVRYMLRARQTFESLLQSERNLAQTARQLELLNQELKSSRDQALELVRLKNEFLATVSHELLTPMNGVLGMTSLLLDTPLTTDQQDFAETIKMSGEGLLVMLKDLLLLTQSDPMSPLAPPCRFDLGELLTRVVGAAEPHAHRKGLRVAAEWSPDVPHQAYGDVTAIETVLNKLLDNAVKFTDQGTVIARVKLDSGAAAASTIRFEIHDTGIGIAANDLPRLFQPLTQVDGSFARRQGGLGVGLAIAKKLVDYMGGEIGVISELGQGSTFWFTLKLSA